MRSRKSCGNGLSIWLASGNLESAGVPRVENLQSFTWNSLAVLLMLAGDTEMNPGPRFQCRLCKQYCKASDKVVECDDCKKRFHATCSELGIEAFEKIESGIDT